MLFRSHRPSNWAAAIRRHVEASQEAVHMGRGKGLILWLLGIPLPIIILLAIFWRW